MNTLTKGANAVLGPQELNGVVIGVRWHSDSVECDLVALVCGENRKVLGDDHMVFFNNLISPDRTVFLRQTPMNARVSGDRGQVQVHLAALPAEAHRVVIALAALEPGVSLTSVSGIEVEAFDPVGGRTLARYEVGPEKTGTVCLILAEVYRRREQWRIRAVGQGYASGLTGLVRDHGVTVDDGG